MNEWETIAWVCGIGAVLFGAVWAIIADVRRGVHARVERCEHVIDEVIRDCSKKKDTFITTSAFDRFEHHLTNRFDGLGKSVEHLTKRIDDFIISHRNGKAE